MHMNLIGEWNNHLKLSIPMYKVHHFMTNNPQLFETCDPNTI